MKTLKWFSLEYYDIAFSNSVLISVRKSFCSNFPQVCFKTEEEAFNWLEANGYIERTKENERRIP